MAVPHRGRQPRVKPRVGDALQPPEIPVYRPAISAKAASFRLRRAERDDQLAARAVRPWLLSNQWLCPAHRNFVLTKVLSMEASVGRPVAAMA
jgi:hypothetical protein